MALPSFPPEESCPHSLESPLASPCPKLGGQSSPATCLGRSSVPGFVSLYRCGSDFVGASPGTTRLSTSRSPCFPPGSLCRSPLLCEVSPWDRSLLDGACPQTATPGPPLSSGSAAQAAGSGQSWRVSQLGTPAQDPEVALPTWGAGQSGAAFQHRQRREVRTGDASECGVLCVGFQMGVRSVVSYNCSPGGGGGRQQESQGLSSPSSHT